MAEMVPAIVVMAESHWIQQRWLICVEEAATPVATDNHWNSAVFPMAAEGKYPDGPREKTATAGL